MDFGSILEQWDRLSVRPAAPRRPDGKAARKPDPVEVWLREHGVYDKDEESEEAPAQAGERRRRLLRKHPDASIDLHGLKQDEAWSALDGFFRRCKNDGMEKVLVVHGKGNHPGSEGVLRDLVRRFVESSSLAGESGYSPAADGGSGATWVVLK